MKRSVWRPRRASWSRKCATSRISWCLWLSRESTRRRRSSVSIGSVSLWVLLCFRHGDLNYLESDSTLNELQSRKTRFVFWVVLVFTRLYFFSPRCINKQQISLSLFFDAYIRLCVCVYPISGTGGSAEPAFSDLPGGNEPRRGSPELAPAGAPHSDRCPQRAGELTVYLFVAANATLAEPVGPRFLFQSSRSALFSPFCSLRARDHRRGIREGNNTIECWLRCVERRKKKKKHTLWSNLGLILRLGLHWVLLFQSAEPCAVPPGSVLGPISFISCNPPGALIQTGMLFYISRLKTFRVMVRHFWLPECEWAGLSRILILRVS